MKWHKHLRRNELWLVDGSGRIVGVVGIVDTIGEDYHYTGAVYRPNEAVQFHVGRYTSQKAAKKAVEDWWAPKEIQQEAHAPSMTLP